MGVQGDIEPYHPVLYGESTVYDKSWSSNREAMLWTCLMPGTCLYQTFNRSIQWNTTISRTNNTELPATEVWLCLSVQPNLSSRQLTKQSSKLQFGIFVWYLCDIEWYHSVLYWYYTVFTIGSVAHTSSVTVSWVGVNILSTGEYQYNMVQYWAACYWGLAVPKGTAKPQ
jgi:hypothetical protein